MKTTTSRLLPFLLAAAALAFLATSCRNTIRGAGQDVERTGNNIQNATR